MHSKVKTTTRHLLAALLLALPMTATAQSDFGIWYGAGAEKKLGKKWTVGIEGEFRTRNDSRTADRWNFGAGADWKPMKHLRVGAGYDFIYDNNRENISRHDDGELNNWRPSYWGTRHRVHADVTGSLDVGRVRLQLRERWQYTYRPEKTTDRYDFDNAQWEERRVKGKGRNVLRSRLQAAWDIRHSKIEPWANVELFNAWNLAKTRYTIGADWKVSKHHAVTIFYRYQDVNDDDENEPDEHIVGLSYKFKF